MIRKTSWALLAAAVLALPARADIYKCVDDQGRKTYTDSPAGHGNCRLLDVPGGALSTVAPVRRADAPRKTVSAPVAPGGFPRVNASEQKARDDDRRAILADELREEEKRLLDLKTEYNNGEPERQGNEKNYAKYQERVANLRDNIARSEKNIEAIRHEISNIK
ncbi:MAG: DUF4124 domain-containing protein [Telluria sp.]